MEPQVQTQNDANHITNKKVCTPCSNILEHLPELFDSQSSQTFRGEHHPSFESFVDAVRAGCLICHTVCFSQPIVQKQAQAAFESHGDETSSTIKIKNNWKLPFVKSSYLLSKAVRTTLIITLQTEKTIIPQLQFSVIPSLHFSVLRCTANGRSDSGVWDFLKKIDSSKLPLSVTTSSHRRIGHVVGRTLEELQEQPVRIKPPEFIHEGLLQKLPGSSQALLASGISQAIAWIKQCSVSHSRCRAYESNDLQYYPKRLLMLQELGQGTVRLIDSSESQPHGLYATLSHCWGDIVPFRLLQKNIEAFKTGISLHLLPRTFREAITLASKIGAAYIWIDSLCIIQDSANDWQQRAPEMADVYSKSLVNISATMSLNSTHGLASAYTQRLNSENRIVQVQSKAGTSQSYTIIDDLYARNRIREAPLNSRAWVIQERCLAQRVLHFGFDQILFECRTHIASQEFPTGIPESLCDFSPCPLVPEAGLEPTVNLKIWYTILKLYAGAHLTNSGDILVAIGGLAKKMQPLIGGDYLAGIWMNDLAQGLLWWVESPGSSKPSHRTPTWSWASTNGKFFRIWESPHVKTIIKLFDYKLESPAHGNGFDFVQDAYIRLSGPIFEGTIDKLKPKNERWGIRSQRVRLRLRNELLDWSHEGVIETVYFAPLRENTHDLTYQGLILSRTTNDKNHQGWYERIGIFVAVGEQDLEDYTGSSELYETAQDGQLVYRII